MSKFRVMIVKKNGQPVGDAYNSKLSKTYAEFANALDEVKGIVPVDNHYLFDEYQARQARIDNAYQSLIMISRPHLRRFAEEQEKSHG